MLGGAAGEVAGVAVAVADRAVRVAADLQEDGGGAFQEPAVVGDGDGDATPGAEVLLQPGQGRVVEVVRGFVEEQDLGSGGQQGGQAQADLFAAGEAADGAVTGQSEQSEAVQGAFDAGVGVVAPAQFEGGEEVGVGGEGLVRGVTVGHAGLGVA